MLRKDGTFPVTFDTELEVYEEMMAVATRMDAAIPDGSPQIAIKNRFEEVFNFFQRMYRMNQALLDKIQEQNATILGNASKIATIVRFVEEDGKILDKYKREFDEVTGIITHLELAERKSRQILADLDRSVTTLQVQVARGEAFCYGEPTSIGYMQQDVNNLITERDKAAAEIAGVGSEIARTQEDLKIINESIGKSQEMSAAQEAQIAELTSRYDALRAENQQTRDSICELRFLVERGKQMMDKNKVRAKEFGNVILEKKALNYDLGKQEIELSSQNKAHRFNLGQKTKQSNKTARRNQSLSEALDKLESQTRQAAIQREHLIAQAHGVESSVEAGVASLAATNAKCEEVEKAKHSARQSVEDRRDVDIRLKHTEVRQENERSRLVRRVQRRLRDRETVRVKLQGEKQLTDTMVARNIDAVRGIRANKKALQKEKMLLRNYEREIELKKFATSKVVAQTALVVDDGNEARAKINTDSDALDELNRKLDQQSDLAEDLRKERNLLKREYEACLQEQTQLLNSITDVTLLVRELHEKQYQKEIQIADQHFRWKEAEQETVLLRASVQELYDLVIDANHSITSLACENQLLKQIMSEAASDRLLQAKEYDAVRGARKAVAGILLERRRTADELKAKIHVIGLEIEQGAKEYRQKCEEVRSLNQEAAIAIERNVELHSSRQRVIFHKHEEHRLFSLVIQENKKLASLTDEAAVPRNVHRWDMYAAIDQTYTRTLRYFAKLTGKMDRAHRQLIRLMEERNKLKAQLAARQKREVVRDGPDEQSCREHFERYKADLAEKESAIREMEAQVDRQHEDIHGVQRKLGALHGRVNDRRSVCSELKSRNLVSRHEKRQQLLFMTEPSASVQIGGGYIAKLDGAQPREGQNSFSGLDDRTVATAIRSNRRHYKPGAPSSNEPARILRPQTNAFKRRPHTTMASPGVDP
jgi:chromosome segregation ATPase